MVIEDVATCLRLTFSWCWLDNSITLYFYHFFIKSFKACWLIPLFLSFTNSPRNLDLQWKPVSWHLQLLILLLPRPSYAFLFPENSNEEVRLWIKLLCICFCTNCWYLEGRYIMTVVRHTDWGTVIVAPSTHLYNHITWTLEWQFILCYQTKLGIVWHHEPKCD